MATRLALGAALLVLLPGPAGARGRTIVWFRTASVQQLDDLKTPTRWIQIEQDGSWQREDKVAKGRGTTITRQWGTLEQQVTTKLFRAATRIARGRTGGRIGSRDSKQGHETLALLGFGRGLRLLQRSGKAASPGFNALARLMEGADLTVKEPAGRPIWGIAHSSWTMAGEGARSSMRFDSRGLLRDEGGGDIGCGYDEILAERFVAAPALTQKIHAGVAALVKKHGLKPGRGLEPPRMGRGHDSSYTLHGFGTGPITVRGAAAQDLAAVLAPLHRPRPYPPRLPFVVGRVRYSATLPGGESLEGTLHTSGHHVSKKGRGKPRVTLLAPGRLQRLFGALQRAVDRPPAAPASTGSPAVGHVALYSLHFKNNRLNLGAKQHDGLRARVQEILARRLLRVSR